MEAERALGFTQPWKEKFSKPHWLSDPAGPVPGQLCPVVPPLEFASSAENRSGHSGRTNLLAMAAERQQCAGETIQSHRPMLLLSLPSLLFHLYLC